MIKFEAEDHQSLMVAVLTTLLDLAKNGELADLAMIAQKKDLGIVRFVNQRNADVACKLIGQLAHYQAYLRDGGDPIEQINPPGQCGAALAPSRPTLRIV